MKTYSENNLREINDDIKDYKTMEYSDLNTAQALMEDWDMPFNVAMDFVGQFNKVNG